MKTSIRHSNYVRRKLVPASMCESRVANLFNMPVADCGAAARRRMMGSKAKTVTVIVDVDGAVYVALREFDTLRQLIATYPHVLIGVYGRTATAADIAEDLGAHCGEMAA